MKKTYTLSPLISLCFFQCSGRSETKEADKGQEKGFMEDLENAMVAFFDGPKILIDNLERLLVAANGWYFELKNEKKECAGGLERTIKDIADYLCLVVDINQKGGGTVNDKELVTRVCRLVEEFINARRSFDYAKLGEFNLWLSEAFREIVTGDEERLILLSKKCVCDLHLALMGEMKSYEATLPTKSIMDKIDRVFRGLIAGKEPIDIKKEKITVFVRTLVPICREIGRSWTVSPLGLDPRGKFLFDIVSSSLDCLLEGHPMEVVRANLVFFSNPPGDEYGSGDRFFRARLHLCEVERTLNGVGKFPELVNRFSPLFFVFPHQMENYSLTLVEGVVDYLENVFVRVAEDHEKLFSEVDKINFLRTLPRRIFPELGRVPHTTRDIQTSQDLYRVFSWVLSQLELGRSLMRIDSRINFFLSHIVKGKVGFSSLVSWENLVWTVEGFSQGILPVGKLGSAFNELMPLFIQHKAVPVLNYFMDLTSRFLQSPGFRNFGPQKAVPQLREDKIRCVQLMTDGLSGFFRNLEKGSSLGEVVNKVQLFVWIGVWGELLRRLTLDSSEWDVYRINEMVPTLLRFCQECLPLQWASKVSCFGLSACLRRCKLDGQKSFRVCVEVLSGVDSWSRRMSLADPVIAIRALRMSRLLGIATGRELVRCGEQVGEHFGSSFRECCSEEDKNEFLVKTMKGILSLGAEIEGIEYCTIDLLESEPVENVVNNIIEIVKLAFDYFMGERRGRFSVEDLVRKAVPTD